MITTISNIVNSGGSPAALLPDQISNLACTGGTDGSQGTIDVSFTEIPATSFDLLKYYILIYKAGGIPQTPFDGTRITLQKATAGAKLEHQITGLTFDRLYGVRIYPVSVKNQFQTLAEGATATTTPVAGIDLGSLSIGDRIAFPIVTSDGINEYGNEIVWKVIGKNHQGYPDNSVTLMTDKIITLKCFDAKEPNNSDVQRSNYGNNRYRYSNTRQWLNSIASAGNWYSPQHSVDAPPNVSNVDKGINAYENKAGFLNMFSSSVISSFMETEIVSGKSDEDGGGTETITDRVFLASCTEMGLLGDHVSGNIFSVFNSDYDRLAYPTAECVDQTDGSFTDLSPSLTWSYWLRDADSSNSFNMFVVSSAGRITNQWCSIGYVGIRPVCNLSQNLKVNSNPRADGIYELIEG